jgi:hypothetical protein
LPRPENEIFAALAFVRPELTRVSYRPLPEIKEAAGERAWRKFKNQGSTFRKIGKRLRVRRGRVGGEDAEFVLEIDVVDIAEVARAERFARPALSLRHRHVRQGPNVSLGGALEVECVV